MQYFNEMKIYKFKDLIKKLDPIYSWYIRLSALNEEGYLFCFTCGLPFTFRQVDCGHYAGRGNISTRFMEENTQVQCRKCNRFSEGMKDIFAIKLQEKYGEDILQKINDQKNSIKFLSARDLEDKIIYYKSEVKRLKKEKTIL